MIIIIVIITENKQMEHNFQLDSYYIYYVDAAWYRFLTTGTLTISHALGIV